MLGVLRGLTTNLDISGVSTLSEKVEDIRVCIQRKEFIVCLHMKRMPAAVFKSTFVKLITLG